ncbi:hypothetical protein C8Q77DRAFT_691177 [Trametes polyzona]|nr:hypothetical protein C8Q77DRAFT_691177 [Trametes polyzona]
MRSASAEMARRRARVCQGVPRGWLGSHLLLACTTSRMYARHASRTVAREPSPESGQIALSRLHLARGRKRRICRRPKIQEIDCMTTTLSPRQPQCESRPDVRPRRLAHSLLGGHARQLTSLLIALISQLFARYVSSIHRLRRAPRHVSHTATAYWPNICHCAALSLFMQHDLVVAPRWKYSLLAHHVSPTELYPQNTYRSRPIFSCGRAENSISPFCQPYRGRVMLAQSVCRDSAQCFRQPSSQRSALSYRASGPRR